MENFTSSQHDLDESSDSADRSMELEFIVVGTKCRNNKDLRKALDYFRCPVRYSDTGLEHMHEADPYQTVFVLDKFDGDIFHRLHRAHCRILGPPVIIQCAQNEQHLPANTRPLYCMVLRKQILCFTGFKVKEELGRLADLVHHMGASVRRDLNIRVTYLVSNTTSGEKYRAAVSLGTPIVSGEWVHRAWENRDVTNADVESSLMIAQCCLNPFSFTILSFYGLSRDETRHMEDLTVDNGGAVVEAGAPQATHLVVDEHAVKNIPFDTSSKLHIVKAEWFWASIQVEARADESFYRFEEPCGNTPSSRTRKSTPGSTSRKRKRELKEWMAQLASEGEVDTPMFKRQSGDLGRLSFSSSFLDATVDTSSGTPMSDACPRENAVSGSPTQSSVLPKTHQKDLQKLTARQQVVMELFQTEKNYVGILHVILKIFKEELEKPDQRGELLLDSQHIKTIFGGIPPIYDIHAKMRDELCEIVTNWKEDQLVGDVILKHADSMLKTYPAFVNYLEKAKETIAYCDKSKPRFHAFLKVCQSKPECGRQSLTELLIRPVQRLPSVMLLLRDILKRTEESNLDYRKITQCIAKLEEVMTHINEDRRIAEGHQAMFDVINDIENCPPALLSAHRSFITKLDCVEVTGELTGKGNCVTLFVFSDSLEICKVKRRGRALNGRSPVHTPRTPQRAYKHLEVLQFSSIKRIVNIAETRDCQRVFALITKKIDDKVEKMYAFAITDDMPKEEFVMLLSKNICTNMCRTDHETLLTTVEPHVLQIETNSLGGNSIGRVANEIGRRVSRVFSMNKTPRALRRAMSSMTQVINSPMRRESGVFTPRLDRRTLRQASTMDLTDTEPSSFGLTRTPSSLSMASIVSSNLP